MWVKNISFLVLPITPLVFMPRYAASVNRTWLGKYRGPVDSTWCARLGTVPITYLLSASDSICTSGNGSSSCIEFKSEMSMSKSSQRYSRLQFKQKLCLPLTIFVLMALFTWRVVTPAGLYMLNCPLRYCQASDARGVRNDVTFFMAGAPFTTKSTADVISIQFKSRPNIYSNGFVYDFTIEVFLPCSMLLYIMKNCPVTHYWRMPYWKNWMKFSNNKVETVFAI